MISLYTFISCPSGLMYDGEGTSEEPTFRVLILTSHELYVRQMPLDLSLIDDPKYDMSVSSTILRLWGMLPVMDAGISYHCAVHYSTCQLNSKCLCLIFSVHLETLTSSMSLVMIL